MQNNLATGPVNINSGRRRRRSVSVNLYTVGQARIFYSTPCSSPADNGKYSNSTTISSCVAKRLAACNLVFGNTGSAYTWTVPSGMTFSVVDITFSGYIVLAISQIAGVPMSTALALASSLGMSTSTQSSLGKQRFIKFFLVFENEYLFLEYLLKVLAVNILDHYHNQQ